MINLRNHERENELQLVQWHNAMIFYRDHHAPAVASYDSDNRLLSCSLCFVGVGERMSINSAPYRSRSTVVYLVVKRDITRGE